MDFFHPLTYMFFKCGDFESLNRWHIGFGSRIERYKIQTLQDLEKKSFNKIKSKNKFK
jgi:hypothetical protein